jgi:hypothetical protein
MLAGYAELNQQSRSQDMKFAKDIRQLPRYLSYCTFAMKIAASRLQQLLNNTNKDTSPVIFLSSCIDATVADLPLPTQIPLSRIVLFFLE